MEKEDILKILQDSGFGSFSISNSIQQGTWVFHTEQSLTLEQQNILLDELDNQCDFLCIWHKSWLTVYPQIKLQTLNRFVSKLNDFCQKKHFFLKGAFHFLEREDFSARQIAVRINFSKPVSKKILHEFCLDFQFKTDIFCDMISNNVFLIDGDRTVDKESILQEQKKAKEQKLYAYECGKLSQRLGLPFINVLAIGLDEKLLERHLLTINRAAGLIAAQEKIEKKLLYFQLFKGNRENKESAVKSLGIEIGNADVMRLDFSMLKRAFK